MKLFKFLAVLISLITTIQVGSAQGNPITVSSEKLVDSVEFTLSNETATPLAVTYIIIQDDILMISSGTVSVPPNSSTVFEVPVSNPHTHSIELQVVKVLQE